MWTGATATTATTKKKLGIVAVGGRDWNRTPPEYSPEASPREFFLLNKNLVATASKPALESTHTPND
jgi:hypothetical protein